MSTSDIPRPPQGTTLAALKGLAIATSFLSAGQLATISTLLPSLYPAAQTSHKLAAQQFATQYHALKRTRPAAPLVTTIICSGLAYVNWVEDKAGRKWKLWATAAGVIFSTIPWTRLLMERPSKRLLWVAEVAPSASMFVRKSSGIGVQVTSATPERSPSVEGKGDPKSQHLAGGTLGVPGSGSDKSKHGIINSGAITPMEEFEPFEDAEMDENEYEQLKVIKLLKDYNFYNLVRLVAPLTAGVLGLWAALVE